MLVAHSDGEAAGCVTYRGITNISGGCEMKRLLGAPGISGTGLGERLVLGPSSGGAGGIRMRCISIPSPAP